MYPVTLSRDSITVVIDGTPHTVHNQHKNYKLVMDAFNAKEWSKLSELVKIASAIEHASNGMFKVKDGRILVEDEDGKTFKCPADLSEQIFKFIDEGNNCVPLVMFARKLSKNPDPVAQKDLFAWIKEGNLTITDSGNFIAYKGVREDMTDTWTGTVDNNVGETPTMDRSDVNPDPNVACAKGLHAATYEYAHNHYGGAQGKVTIMVEIDPKDVVAVPKGEVYKMRVCKYSVVAISQCNYDGAIFDKDLFGI